MFVVEITNKETKETRYIESTLHIRKELTDLCKFDDFEDANNLRHTYIMEYPSVLDFYIIEVVQY